jgi:cell division protein FtsN
MNRALLAVLVLMVVPCVASAHHSAARFDLTIRDRMVTGIVKEWQPANPHTKIVLEITDEKGTRDVEFEGHSLNNYYRAGWRQGMVKVGDKITLNAAPTKDGSDGGYALGVVAADGTKF